MKVIEYNRIGNPAEGVVKKGASRAPGEGEIRVKVLATPFTPASAPDFRPVRHEAQLRYPGRGRG